jgi:short-subunit dehydrogenase
MCVSQPDRLPPGVSGLQGKRIAVTGASGGIGKPVVQLLREAGAEVTAIGRTGCVQSDVSLVADLSDDNELAGLAGILAADAPDILVNIAGVMDFGLHERQSHAALARCFHLNLLVPATLARAVAGPMRRRGSGQIVTVGSVLGLVPYPWFAAYSASKAGLAALSQGLRRELAGSGVAVTHISPRAAKTSLIDGDVGRFLALAGMQADPPDWVAQRIVRAIAQRRASVTLGTMERVYALLNAVSPRLVDLGLAGQVRKARAAFP